MNIISRFKYLERTSWGVVIIGFSYDVHSLHIQTAVPI